MPRTMTFGPLTVTYDERVLEPRPWTLAQARWAAELARSVPDGPVLELCSGAGHIGQAAAALTGRRLVQVDVDRHACDLAEANAAVNLATAVEVRCADLDEAVAGGERFPIVLADPPYLPTDELDRFPADPALAIDGGPDGLALPRRCLVVSGRHVHPDGVVLLQALGQAQVDALRADVDAAGLQVEEVRVEDDRRAVALLRPTVR